MDLDLNAPLLSRPESCDGISRTVFCFAPRGPCLRRILPLEGWVDETRTQMKEGTCADGESVLPDSVISNSLRRVESAIGSWYGSYAYFHEAYV